MLDALKAINTEPDVNIGSRVFPENFKQSFKRNLA